MATFSHKLSTHVHMGEQPVIHPAHHGLVRVLSSTFLHSEDLQPGQSGLLVGETVDVSVDPEELATLRGMNAALRSRELYKKWYKGPGRKIEKEILANLQGAAPPELSSSCYAARLQDVLRTAFLKEEDEDLQLLELCTLAIQQHPAQLPAESYIALHRMICDANSSAHSEDAVSAESLARLLSPGPKNAEAVAAAAGQPSASTMLRSMASALLPQG